MKQSLGIIALSCLIIATTACDNQSSTDSNEDSSTSIVTEAEERIFNRLAASKTGIDFVNTLKLLN